MPLLFTEGPGQRQWRHGVVGRVPKGVKQQMQSLYAMLYLVSAASGYRSLYQYQTQCWFQLTSLCKPV